MKKEMNTGSMSTKMSTKEKIQYGSAVGMLLSAVVLAYFSFFLLNTIVGSVLGYVSIAVGFAGAIYGISAYVKNEYIEMTTKLNEQLNNRIQEYENEREKKIKE